METLNAMDEMSDQWMKQGIAVMSNPSGDLDEAERCFDEALNLRRRMPLDQSPWYPYHLAGTLLNKAELAMKTESSTRSKAVSGWFHEAIKLLDTLPPNKHPLFERRQVIALLNAGIHRELEGDLDKAAQLAEKAFKRTIVSKMLNRDDRNRLLTTAQLQLLGARIENKTIPWNAIEANLREILRRTKREERLRPEWFALGLKTRLLLARWKGRVLSGPELGNGERDQAFYEASDVIDEGMKTVRSRFATKANFNLPELWEMFHLGCELYLNHRIHFLPEFILENLDPVASAGALGDSPQMHAIALDSIKKGVACLQGQRLHSGGHPIRQSLERITDLLATGRRLEEIREEYLQSEILPLGGKEHAT